MKQTAVSSAWDARLPRGPRLQLALMSAAEAVVKPASGSSFRAASIIFSTLASDTPVEIVQICRYVNRWLRESNRMVGGHER